MRRKQDYHKALHKKHLCQSVYGDANWWLGGILGRYDKGKIHDHEDYRKTNSERHGYKNYRHSDKKRYDRGEQMLHEYRSNGT